MSETTTVVTPAPVPTNDTQPEDSLRSPQFIIASLAMVIVAGTVAAVFARGDLPSINLAIGFVFGALGSAPLGFYFGSSQGSQKKDAVIAAKVPPVQGTTTTTTMGTPLT